MADCLASYYGVSFQRIQANVSKYMEEEITKTLNRIGKANLGLTIKPVTNGYPLLNAANNKNDKVNTEE